MLHYLGHGTRTFGLVPMHVHRRAHWECFAVLDGICRAVTAQPIEPPPCRHHLWIFPPETAHGWTGRGAEPCRIAVFHFRAMPALIERLVQPPGYLVVPLSPAGAHAVSRWVEEVRPHYERITEKSLLVFERLLLDLALLALDAIPDQGLDAIPDAARRKVDACITWYLEHMEEQPKLERVARAAHVSVRHMRRLFQETRGDNPQSVFAALRLQRAMDMLAQSDHKMDVIARACGFRSTSDFGRVFKLYRGVSPDAWRRRLADQGVRTR